jgi:subtilase family serine protease
MIAQRDGVRKPARFLILSSLFLFGTNCAFAQAVARVTENVDNANHITLTGNVHPLARSAFDRGAVDNALPLKRVLMLLKRGDHQEAALQTYTEQQQDKSSPNYHLWLTPQQFGAQYGPADSDVLAVTQWLQNQGFTIEKVYSGKTVIEFSGNAAQVQTAFSASLHNYSVNGKMYVANANDPQIPAALAPVIAGIVSLNNFPRQSHLRLTGHARKIAGQPGLQPLFTFPNPFGGSGNFYGVGPADFAKIYNSLPLLNATTPINGSGQTIAVVGETNINVADVQAFRQMFGLSANFSSSNIILNGEDPGITTTDEEAEADLDVQWSGAAAPGATIDFVVSASTAASQGVDLSALYIIEYNLAGVVSESYGACEAALGSAGNAFYNSLWEQAAAQGITAVLSAGDGGSAGCDDFNTATVATQGLAVSGLASTPYNVAMGGTDFDEVNKWTTYWSASNSSTTRESALSYIPEIPWNENCAQISLTGCGANAPQGSVNIVAGSGGASTSYAKPKWQMGITGMPNDSHRDLPDLSLFASTGFDGSGYIICPGTGQEAGASQCNATPGVYNFGIVGGTSASTPAFAGIMALVNQYESTHGGTTRQGNPNYTLYPLSKKSGASCTSSATEAATCIFNDVTKGNSALPTGAPGVGTNSVPCQGATPNCSVTVASSNGVLVEPTSSTTEAYTASAGYDLTTGLGSVNIHNLVTGWNTVNTVATTTTLTLSPTTGITHGTAENVTVNVTVTPTTGTATGEVSLIATLAGPNGSTTQGLDQFTLNSSGKVANGTTNSLPGSTNYQVYAHYAGDGTNAPSDSAPVNVTVAKEPSQSFIVIPTFDYSGHQTNGNATSVPYGSNYFIRMYVADKNAVGNPAGPPSPTCYQENQLTCPSGTVTLTDNGNALGTGGGGAGIYNLNNAGYTRNLTPSLTAGTHTLVAAYNGDNSYQKSASAMTALTVTPATMQLSLTVPTHALSGVAFSISATGTTSAVGAAPMGTLSLYDGSTLLFTLSGAELGGYGGTGAGSGPTATAGFGIDTSATLSTHGPHSLALTYSGDPSYSAAPSSPQNVNVVYSNAMTLQSSATTVSYGTSITLTAILTTTQTGPPVTGQITFTSSSGQQSIVVASNTQTVINGYAALQATATVTLQSGDFFTANYAGDNNYAAASATAPYITVSPPSFNVATSQPGLAMIAGQPADLIITVTPAAAMSASLQLQIPSPVQGITCNVNPTQIPLSGANSVTATLTCSVIAPSSSTSTTQIFPSASPKLSPRSTWSKLSGLLAALALVLLLFPFRLRLRRLAYGSLILSTLSFAAGCGGGAAVSGGGGANGGGGGSGLTPSTTTLSVTSTKITPGSNLMATVQVSGNSPTGQVSLGVVGESYSTNTKTLTNGQAQFSYYLGSAGGYLMTAQYSGDSRNGPSQIQAPLAVVQTGAAGSVTVNVTIGPTTKQVNVPLTVQ